MDGKAGLKWLEDRDQKPRIARGFWLLQAAAHGSCADPWGLAADGALPRKTFSMGEANEKRYYIESRYIGK